MNTLEQQIQKYNTINRWKKPLRTEAGYYLLFKSGLCKARSDRINAEGYHNRQKDFIYINLQRIFKEYPQNPLDRLLFVLNHEYLHYLFNQQYKEEYRHIYRMDFLRASGLIDFPHVRRWLDGYLSVNGSDLTHMTDKEFLEYKKRYFDIK